MSERRPLILVVEDDPAVRGLIGDVLEEAGYEVLPAADGLEGLVKLELRHPALVILDLRMPNVEGDRVIQEIQEDVRLSGVPIVVVSAREDAADTFGTVVGPRNVFRKPFDPDELVDRVREILSEHGIRPGESE